MNSAAGCLLATNLEGSGVGGVHSTDNWVHLHSPICGLDNNSLWLRFEKDGFNYLKYSAAKHHICKINISVPVTEISKDT